jgi:ferredoxin-NADP reductase
VFDFISRALAHPADYAGALRLHQLTLRRSEYLGGITYSFVFECKRPLRWKSGQHGVFWFLSPTMKGSAWRAFSVASSADEEEIRIATQISNTPSTFKQKLKRLQPGEHIYMQGPFGEFHADNKTHMVGVAGGIGITPFRALAYDLAHTQNAHAKLTLIYSAPNNTHVFKEELKEWSQTKNVDVIYTATPAEVNAALHDQIETVGNNGHYLISGSPTMIAALREFCQQKGITNIINDPFKGY